jgi:hypothetical protein
VVLSHADFNLPAMLRARCMHLRLKVFPSCEQSVFTIRQHNEDGVHHPMYLEVLCCATYYHVISRYATHYWPLLALSLHSNGHCTITSWSRSHIRSLVIERKYELCQAKLSYFLVLVLMSYLSRVTRSGRASLLLITYAACACLGITLTPSVVSTTP